MNKLKMPKKLKIHKKLVHAGSSRHHDLKKKIQSKLEALAHPEFPYSKTGLNYCWVEDDGTFATLQK